MEDIIKVIKSLEKTGIFLKGTAGKIISQKAEFLNIDSLLVRIGFPNCKMYLHH